jgi:hypothetical protein
MTKKVVAVFIILLFFSVFARSEFTCPTPVQRPYGAGSAIQSLAVIAAPEPQSHKINCFFLLMKLPRPPEHIVYFNYYAATKRLLCVKLFLSIIIKRIIFRKSVLNLIKYKKGIFAVFKK